MIKDFSCPKCGSDKLVPEFSKTDGVFIDDKYAYKEGACIRTRSFDLVSIYVPFCYKEAVNWKCICGVTVKTVRPLDFEPVKCTVCKNEIGFLQITDRETSAILGKNCLKKFDYDYKKGYLKCLK